MIFYDSRFAKLRVRKTVAQLLVENHERSPTSTPARKKVGDLGGEPAR